MNTLNFNRFKKKSLIVLYRLLSESVNLRLAMNRKLIQSATIALMDKVVPKIALKGHDDRVTCLVKLNEKQIATGSWDKTIKVWNLDDGSCAKTLEGHKNAVTCIVKLNEKQIASGRDDRTIKV